MDKENTMSMGGFAFIALFLLILFALFNNGGLWGNRGNAVDTCHHNHCHTSDAIWNAEKQQIIDSARTNYNIEAQASETRQFLGNKLDFYAYTDIRDKLADEKAKNLYLQGQIDNDRRFYALDTKLNDIACNMCVKPPVYCGGGNAPATFEA